MNNKQGTPQVTFATLLIILGCIITGIAGPMSIREISHNAYVDKKLAECNDEPTVDMQQACSRIMRENLPYWNNGLLTVFVLAGLALIGFGAFTVGNAKKMNSASQAKTDNSKEISENKKAPSKTMEAQESESKGDDVAQKIRELAEMKEKGLIDEKEYKKLKNKLISK